MVSIRLCGVVYPSHSPIVRGSYGSIVSSFIGRQYGVLELKMLLIYKKNKTQKNRPIQWKPTRFARMTEYFAVFCTWIKLIYSTTIRVPVQFSALSLSYHHQRRYCFECFESLNRRYTQTILGLVWMWWLRLIIIIIIIFLFPSVSHLICPK